VTCHRLIVDGDDIRLVPNAARLAS
jgi:hypothetical protein